MKMRNKGKVHPFTSSSSSYAPNKESLSVLKLLPAAIFTLVSSVLSVEDREVLAYMITRSLKSTTSSSPAHQSKLKRPKKQSSDCRAHNSAALFDCDCFDCYTSFWFRWDSSPNRELIHQAIEAFEEHLNNRDGEQQQLNNSANAKSKRRERMGRRKGDHKIDGRGALLQISAAGPPANQDTPAASAAAGLPLENELVDAAESDNVASGRPEEAEEADTAAPPPSAAVVHNHRGLARKVLPDVMGIFNSRLWSLWSPNV